MLVKYVTGASLIILAANAARAEAPVLTAPSAISQALLDAVREVSGVPGFSAAVWHDGAVVWTGTAGLRDIEHGLPVTRDTRFRLASVSKLVTATAVAKLAEDGLIDLDAPVAAILPWLKNDWPLITARQLAAHTSGLPHYQAVDDDRGTVSYPNGKSAVALFADRPLLSAPGAQYSYSSWGYTLLGALVEEVTRQSFEDYIAAEIVPDLGLGVDATDSGAPDVTHAYQFVGGVPEQAPSHDYSYTVGGGGLMASAEGVVRFGGAMLQDRIVSKATFDDMIRPYVLASGAPAGEQSYEVGVGWRSASDSDGHPMAFHNGIANGARASLVLWREEGTAAAILSNAVWISSIDSTAQMLAAPFRDAPSGLIAAECPTHAVRFEGVLSGEPVSGSARFWLGDGICQGELELSGSLRAFFDRGPQPTSASIRLVGLDTGGGLSRAGLVTPFGIYDLRADESGQYRSHWSATRTLEFRLLGADGHG